MAGVVRKGGRARRIARSLASEVDPTRRLDLQLAVIAPHLGGSALEYEARRDLGGKLRDALVNPATGQGASIESLTYVTRLCVEFWDVAFGIVKGAVSFGALVRVAALAGFRIEFRLVPIDPTGDHKHATIEWARAKMHPYTTLAWRRWYARSQEDSDADSE